MDTKTAISRIFLIFSGLNPDLLGADWDRGIADEVAAIRSDELAALGDIRSRIAACAAGYGLNATGVENWLYGIVVLLRVLSRSRLPAVRAFLYEMTRFGGSAAGWLTIQREAQRLIQEGAAASWRNPSAPTAAAAYTPIHAAPPSSPAAVGTASKSIRRPLRGLVLPVILLFVIWTFTLLTGPGPGVYPNSLICIYSSAYCMLLGCALPLLQRRRYVFCAIVLVVGALFSALTLGWAKMYFSHTAPSILLLISFTQFWLDFLVLLSLAVLIVLCGLLLPRLSSGSAGRYTAPISGLVVFAFSTVTMLASLPVVTFLSVLFSLFAGIMLGVLTTVAAVLVDKTETTKGGRLTLRGGAIAWFSCCIALSLGILIWVGTADEAYTPVFMLCLCIIQIVTLIVLLCKRPSGYLWYAITTLALFMCGLTNFLFAYVVSGSWLPLILFAGLFNVIGPALGWLFVRKSFRPTHSTGFANLAGATGSGDTPNAAGAYSGNSPVQDSLYER